MATRDPEVQQKILDRLSRIEGQIRGIKKMIAEERGCYDVLKQVAAVNGALRSLQKAMMESHLEGCLLEAMTRKDDRSDLLHDLVSNLGSLMD
jgi:CsoR family transcriptional regulator, copper-sensing transcriptional repressor